MPINSRRPFTELYECTQYELVREAAAGVEAKYKGFVNQVYVHELPSVLPEDYVKKTAYVTLVADYTTGTVTVGSGTSNIIGDSTAWTAGNSSNLNIKVSGDDHIFRVDFAAGTSLTFQESLTWVGSSGTGLSYVLFQDRYQPASDFAYIVRDDKDKPNSVFVQQNGVKTFLTPITNEDFDQRFNETVNDPPSHYTVKWRDIIGTQTPFLHVWPAPDVVDILGYYYIPRLTSMSEYTTGTATFAATTAVIGAGAMTWSTSISTGTNVYFIRNDADGTGSESLWQQISTVANATALTLSAAWAGSTGTGASYTISNISKWPERFDDAIMYKAALLAEPDIKSGQAQKWLSLYMEAIGLDNAVESKRTRSHKLKFFPGSRQ